MLRINRFAEEMADSRPIVNNEITQAELPHYLATVNAKHAGVEIAAVTSDTIGGNRVIRYRLKGQNSWSATIRSTDPRIEPLCYPLLFPFGEDGWGKETNKNPTPPSN